MRVKKHWRKGLIRSLTSIGSYEWRIDENNPKLNTKMSYNQYYGPRPIKKEYMPDWPIDQRTHYQMYETCTEGTPISPVMESPEALARWLVDNNASAFGDMTADYDHWLRVCRGGYATSAVVSSDGKITSGVEGITENE